MVNVEGGRGGGVLVIVVVILFLLCSVVCMVHYSTPLSGEFTQCTAAFRVCLSPHSCYFV